MLGLTAEFDVKSGYLLVDGEGVLGKQHRGAYDTYTNTLTHHLSVTALASVEMSTGCSGVSGAVVSSITLDAHDCAREVESRNVK